MYKKIRRGTYMKKKRSKATGNSEQMAPEMNHNPVFGGVEHITPDSQSNDPNDSPEWVKTMWKTIHKASRWRTELKKIDKQDIAIYTAISGAAMVLINLMWYFYMLGYFQFYGIGSVYIQFKGDILIYQVIGYLLFTCILVFINLSTYYLFIKKQIAWMIVELLVIAIIMTVAFALLAHETLGFSEFIQLFIRGIIVTLIVSFVGIYLGFYKLWEDKNNKKKSIDANNANHNSCDPLIKVLKFMGAFIIMMSIIVFSFYWAGGDDASKKRDYKVIVENVNGQKSKATYIFQTATPSDAFAVYPIVYETQEQYFVTRLVNKDGAISIDCNYQKIMEKKGIATMRINNIDDENQIIERCSAPE